MWFKKVLLGCYAASLAVMIVTASTTKDATVSRRQHIVKRLIFPSLERRQQSFGNQTSLSETIESTSSNPAISSIPAPSEIPQTSIIINTPSVVTTPGSISSLISTPTGSTTRPTFVLSEPNSGHGSVSSIFRSIDSESSKSSAPLTPEQQPSETPATSFVTPTRETTSGKETSSTAFDTTFFATSSAGVLRPSSTLEVSLSVHNPTSEQTSTTSSAPTSSPEALPVSSIISTSSATEETLQKLPSSISSSINDSSNTNSDFSTIFAPTSQIPIPKTSTVIISAPAKTTVDLPSSSTAPVWQWSTVTPSSFLSASTGDPSPSSAFPESTAAGTLITSTDLPQGTLSTSLSERPSDSTSLPALSSSDISEALSFHTEENLSTSALPLTTAVITNIEESSSSMQTVVASEAVLSSLTPSVNTPGPTSIRDNEISITQTAQPSLSTISLETSAATISSVIQPSLFPSNRQSSSQTLTAASSSLSLMSLSSERVSSSISSGSISTVSGAMSTTIPSPNPSSVVVLTSQQSFSSATVPDSPSATLPSQTGLLSSTLPLATFESNTLVAIPPETASTGPSSSKGPPTVSLQTNISPSATFVSEAISLFAPSETAFSSIIDSTAPSPEPSIKTSPSQNFLTFSLSGTQASFSGHVPTTTLDLQQSTPSTVMASESRSVQTQTSLALGPVSIDVSSASAPRDNASHPSSLVGESQVISLQSPVSVIAPSLKTTASGSIPTSESLSGSGSASSAFGPSSFSIPTSTGGSRFASSAMPTTISLSALPFSSSTVSNSTQTGLIVPTVTGTFTATFSTVYISNIRSSALSLSTIEFSLLSSVTGAAVHQTHDLVSNTQSTVFPSTRSEIWVPASEFLRPSSKLDFDINSTRSSLIQPSVRPSASLPFWVNGTTSSTALLGITFSRSVLPTGISTGTATSVNATQVETVQTSSIQDLAKSTAVPIPSTTSSTGLSNQTSPLTFISDSASVITSTKYDAGTKSTEISPATHTSTSTSTSTPSQPAATGSPPPLTKSQTAGIAVGGTTCLLIAVIAAAFIARRYHAAKHGKRMSTGSIYPKVAYLYDPKTGGSSGDSEALMSGASGGLSPGGLTSRAVRGSPKHMQRHSTGTLPIERFTNLSNPFKDLIRDPAIHRYSDYARMDTANALSAAVAGYPGASRHSSTYTKYPSDVTNPFSNHVIPSPTFAPFSPDDIRRPEVQIPQSTNDGRGDYLQMPINPYAYLNTAASMYPPISPYSYSPAKRPPPAYNTRRQTADSDPFADPFEHDLLLQVDERNRTSDSVTVFASSPNLMPPRTPRTPVGPKLPVRQPNGMSSARSLLSPVAAKYMQKAQEVKIPRRSIASPVLVQVGASRSNRASPVIKPFSPPPPAPEPLGWENIKRLSEKRFSDGQSVQAPLQFASPVIKKKPVPSSHTRMKPSLTGAGQALLAGNGLPLTVKIPHMYNKSVGLEVPKMHGSSGPEHEDESSDPIVREKRSRELLFANPALIGKEF